MRYCFSTRLWNARGLVVWGEVKGLELVIVGWGLEEEEGEEGGYFILCAVFVLRRRWWGLDEEGEGSLGFGLRVRWEERRGGGEVMMGGMGG